MTQEIKDQIASGKRATLATLMVNGRRLSLSESSIQRLASTDERIPDDLAELVEELKAQNPAAEAKTRIVEAGLRALRGAPSKCGQDPEAIAKALADHFPANEFARKLADAFLAQAQIASGNGSLLDVFAQAIAGRVPHIDPARLARIVAKRIARTVPTLSLGRLAFVAVVAAAVASSAWSLLDKRRSHVEPRAAVILVASAGPDGPVVSDPLEWLAKAVEEMGEKPSVPLNQPVPLKPFPGQKVPPCDAGIGEAPINGGCWFGSKDVKPPCGRLFRSGDSCYRPIAADPKKPVGSNSEVPR